MSRKKAGVFHKVKSLGKIRFGLSRKTDDNVACELHTGNCRAQVVKHTHGALGVVFASHCGKRARASALKRNMKMRRKRGKPGYLLNKFRAEQGRLKRTESYPYIAARNLGKRINVAKQSF